MLNFIYEQIVVRFSFYIVFFAIIAIFVYIGYKEVTFQPAGEIAPFTETLTRDNSDALLPEQLSLPLSQPHRTNKELQTWSSMAVSEALSFDGQNYDAAMARVRAYFTASGYAQYQEYLKSSGIIESVQKNDFRMSVFVDEKPLMLNSLALKDVYRWLYQMPITVSFLPRTARDLVGRTDNVSRPLSLNIQIRRVALPDDPNAIQIESWKISPRR